MLQAAVRRTKANEASSAIESSPTTNKDTSSSTSGSFSSVDGKTTNSIAYLDYSRGLVQTLERHLATKSIILNWIAV